MLGRRGLFRSPATDEGSAVVEFVSVVGLLTLLFLAVLQLALVTHVRNTLVDCASEGARYGGLSDRTASDGANRTRDLIAASLGERYASDVSADVVTHDGLAVVEVQVTAPVPVVGLLGTGDTVTVRGHGLLEPR